MQRSFYHEIGHHILERLPRRSWTRLRCRGASGRASPISIRARNNPLEYFCETFAAYRFEDSLADIDPVGYHMIEAILRIAWNR